MEKVKAISDEILEERLRQRAELGYLPEVDACWKHDELARAAAFYATPDRLRDIKDWPFDIHCCKPGDRRRELIKAAALIMAEIERMDFVKEEI